MATQAKALRAQLAATTQIRRKTLAVAPFEVCVFELRTGIVRRWLPLLGAPDFQQGLVLEGSWSASVPIGASNGLTKDEIEAYSTPWYFGWAVCQGEKVWQAGPVIGEDYQGGPQTTVYGAGVWTYLTDKRALLNPARASRAGAAAIDADVAFGTGATSPIQSPIPAENQSLALASVAARLVEIAIDEPGSDLPIDIADTTLPGSTERTYAGFDLGTFGQRLQELSQVENGPEQYFDPYFTAPDRRMLRWRHRVGNPRLGVIDGVNPHVWETGGALYDVTMTKNGSRQAHRAYERGSGMDRNTLVGFSENLMGVTSGPDQVMPLLETVGSEHSQVEVKSTLDSYARADVQTDATPEITLKPVVRIAGDDGKNNRTRSPMLSQVSPGDLAVLRVRDHPRLADGRYTVRVLTIRSANSTVFAALDVQLLAFQPVESA